MSKKILVTYASRAGSTAGVAEAMGKTLAAGGFKRVVWMSSILKEQMAAQLKKVAEREGDPDLIDKICDERIATDVEGLVAYVTEKNHPALSMPSLL